jgi:hypothetical protein
MRVLSHICITLSMALVDRILDIRFAQRYPLFSKRTTKKMPCISPEDIDRSTRLNRRRDINIDSRDSVSGSVCQFTGLIGQNEALNLPHESALTRSHLSTPQQAPSEISSRLHNVFLDKFSARHRSNARTNAIASL